jgi:hypothetical protein
MALHDVGIELETMACVIRYCQEQRDSSPPDDAAYVAYGKMVKVLQALYKTTEKDAREEQHS